MKERKNDIYSISDPGVYIYGRRSVVIDGKAEIVDYTDETVIFRTRKKNVYLRIRGRSLTVRCAGDKFSEVSGRIDGVEYTAGASLC